MTTKELLQQPKLDLHCHLDGSFPPALIHKLVNQTSPQSLEAVTQKLQVPENCQNLGEYLQCFDLPIACMQTPQAVEAGAYQFVQSLQAEHIIYAEVRFAPVLFANRDFTEEQALECALAGLRRGQEEFAIPVNTIVCALRHFSHEENAKTFRIAKDYQAYGVCAVDLAGNEAAFPTAEFAPLFALANALELPFTIHAGECKSAQSIRDAMAFGAKRIGHGIAMAGDLELQAHCVAQGIGVEMCPISNYQTKAVEPDQPYPLAEFLQAGICATVNTDNRTVSDTSLSKEFSFLQDRFGFTPEDLRKVTNNAITCAFASDDVKQSLWKQVNG
ncbi:adenosine deaminase [Bengtsoniella intestinalis]|uniref:adenosine deaminase n=1 Tax=Bengtsoniella intestinalis TaxID=3073143 RepID=UPI00391FA844